MAKAKTAQTSELAAQPRASDLEMALQRAFGMTNEDASAVAEIVAERFEGVREVNDETIDSEVRSLFYTLESRRLLSFRREEYDNEAGEKRRAFWWRLRTDVVAELCAPEQSMGDEDVYAQLPAECWRREAAA
jgi:hypothetical protein